MDPANTERLLKALQDDNEQVREQATAELWRMWFHQKGVDGAQLLVHSQKLFEADQIAEAETLLSELINEQPDFAEAWNRRAVLYYTQGRYWEAIADCQKALAIVPHHFGALHGLGLCHASVGNYTAAIQAFRQAQAIQPFALINQRLILECTAKLS